MEKRRSPPGRGSGQRSKVKGLALCVSAGYLYATLANVIITLTSMLGIVILLCTACTGVFQLCIQFCISLAVGSLSGDALLHLLPMVGSPTPTHPFSTLSQRSI